MRCKNLYIFAALVIALFSQSVLGAEIPSKNYTIQIKDPGFYMEVRTPTGTALPADPTTGPSFLGSAAVSSERLSQDNTTTTYRVTNEILVTSRDTALKRSGPSIPDLPLERLEELPPSRSPVPEDVKRLLVRESMSFNLRPEDVQPGGGSELAKAFSLASGLQLKIDPN